MELNQREFNEDVKRIVCSLMMRKIVKHFSKEPEDNARDFITFLVEERYVREEELVTAIAAEFKLKPANFKAVEKLALEFIPKHLALDFGVCPISVNREANVLTVAVSNPLENLDEIMMLVTGCKLNLVFSTASRIMEAIKENYPARDSSEAFASGH